MDIEGDGASRRRLSGRYFYFTHIHGMAQAMKADIPSRFVLVVPMKMKMIGTHQIAAPIH